MFDKNDRLLLTAKLVLNIIAVLCIVIGIIAGIVIIAIQDGAFWTIGLTILLCVPISGALGWLILRLWLNYLCDVKLIRNKLYGIDNHLLNDFIAKMPTEKSPQPIKNTPMKPTSSKNDGNADSKIIDLIESELKDCQTDTERIRKLKSLLDQNKITQEEFDWASAKLFNYYENF